MKTLQELLNKVSEDKPTREHILDFNTDDLLQFVPFDEAGYFLKPDVTKEEWNGYYRPLKRGNVIGVMEDYMKHAWEICLQKGSKSPRQVISHYHAWLWILEDEEAIEFLLDPDNFDCFGIPILHYICEKYNWGVKSFMEKWQYKQVQVFIEGVGC